MQDNYVGGSSGSTQHTEDDLARIFQEIVLSMQWGLSSGPET